jgi:hypothetical protein
MMIKKMENTELEYIASQTSVTDFAKIKEVFLRNNSNAADTIIELMSLTMTRREINKRHHVITEKENIREILDAKEELYRQACSTQMCI